MGHLNGQRSVHAYSTSTVLVQYLKNDDGIKDGAITEGDGSASWRGLASCNSRGPDADGGPGKDHGHNMDDGTMRYLSTTYVLLEYRG